MALNPSDPAQAQIAVLEAELAAARAELQEFSYTVSHDLRADLRHILAFSEILEEDVGPQLDAQARSHLATISTAARHMGGLMDGLMAYSRLGTVPLQVTLVEPKGMVQDVCLALQACHPQREIEWRVAPGLPAVQADATLLRQVLEHLLDNAVKFTAPRAPAVIEFGWDASSSAFFVRDNGVGFNAAHQAKLFHVFQRLHSQTQFAGLGMGLALTRKIVERHGGWVWAEGEVDAGCCTRFTLPLASGAVDF